MTRPQLEHVLRAAGAISGVNDIIVIGSQAILAVAGELPDELLVSLEADLYPRDNPALADLIDGTIGELSPFHETFGYYAHGVGPETAVLPADWNTRLLTLSNSNTNGVCGWCLHPGDIAIAKLAAGRPKDMQYLRVLFRSGLVSKSQVTRLIPTVPEAHRILIEQRLQCLTQTGG